MAQRSETRANAGRRVRALLADAGLTVVSAAKLFQVTPRTLHNWRTGATRPPCAVLRLLRMMAGFQLPGRGWEGWRMHSGKLWTPEGHAIEPSDGAWWSLLVRQARCFRIVYEDLARLRQQVRLAGGLGVAGAPAGAPAGLVSVSTTHTAADESLADQGYTGWSREPVGGTFRYHFDHGLISCPTPSDYLQSLTRKPVSSVPASVSASTPSLLLHSTPTSGEVGRAAGPAPLRRRASGRQRPLSGGVQRKQVPRLPGLPIPTTGGTSTEIPTCGPTLIRSLPMTRSGSASTLKPMKAGRQLMRSTGEPASDRRVRDLADAGAQVKGGAQ